MCACMCHVCYIYLRFFASRSSTLATPPQSGPAGPEVWSRIGLGDRGAGRSTAWHVCFYFEVPSLPCSDSLRVRAPLRLHTPRRVQGAHLAGRRTCSLTSLKSPSRAYTRTHLSLTQLLSHTHAHSDTHTHTTQMRLDRAHSAQDLCRTDACLYTAMNCLWTTSIAPTAHHRARTAAALTRLLASRQLQRVRGRVRARSAVRWSVVGGGGVRVQCRGWWCGNDGLEGVRHAAAARGGGRHLCRRAWRRRL